MRARLARVLRSIASRLDPSPTVLISVPSSIDPDYFLNAEQVAAIADRQIVLAFNAATDGYEEM